MASQKKAKRALSSDSESDSECQNPSSHFPRFLVIEAEDSSNPITRLSPFIIEKQISSILGTAKSVKRLRNDTLLVECFTMQQASNLLSNKTFFNKPVKIYPHKSLNTCKGVVRCRELSYCDPDEILSNLKSQGVREVKRISVSRNGTRRDTNTYILTFASPNLPSSIKIGFLNVKVDVYVPNPLRCFKCQRYGHHESKCPNLPVCPKCSFEGQDHNVDTCNNPLHCPNCKSNHSSSSRDCPRWKDEKEILSLKYKHNLSFIEARREVENRRKDQLQSSGRQSYSNAVSPTPAKDSCPTCELLAKKLLEKFPDMANELKDLIPSKVLSPSFSSQKPTPQSKPPSSDTSKSSKSSSPDLPKSSASTKTTKPSPQSSNIQKPHSGNSTNDVASQQRKLKTSNTSNPTSVAASKPHRSNSTNSKGPSAAPRRQQKPKPSVEYEPPPQIETTNRFQNLEDMEADQEDLEGDASDSEEYHPDDDWNKNIESWSTSTAETKIIKS